ncbi:uncharacterized protein LOC122274358 [Carya illinoinensis]|uniref:uncharacterized protein LOC122274358 n=1 Tax=Carya illinoinensis TaxID=32201 RepID=UPI001C728A81|nr:uncharacterized protein LOC122274358 [Carya illinoinensis]
MDKNWMHVPNRFTSREYGEGINTLLTMAKTHAPGQTTIRCPCRRCRNNLFLPFNEVEDHLFTIGIDPTYTHWIFHGECDSWSVHESDSDDDSANESHNFIDDMDEMIEDTRAATFFDHAYGEHASTSEPTMGESQSKTFDQLFDDARRPLYPSCKKFSKLSFIVKLLHIKTVGGWTIKSFNMVLQLLKAAFPDIHIPNSYHEARHLERGLGFSYVKIDACPNDCMLFWKHDADKEVCSKCEEPRWVSTTRKKGKIPQKVLRYFPLKPRLQKLFMSKNIAKSMKWHREERLDDHSTLRHPADSKMWRQFDKDHTWFAQDARNVRLGLASDGFNPFNNMSKPYSIWPVILVPYNLPPWLCMKEPYLMLTLLIPGPKGPGNDIDVYLQPLVNELKELWEDGVDSYDASKSEHFRLHAALLWTINDFPAYANLSGWSTKGKLACPLCNEDTDSMWLKHGRKHCYMGHRRFLPSAHPWRKKKAAFNGKDDHRLPPPELTASFVLQQLLQLSNVEFGKTSNRKRKRTPAELNWTKKSIFFELPYWSTLPLRHNLDVMHIEKNICDNVLGTLMDIQGKNKDTVNARKDLEELGLRKELHLQPTTSGYSMVLGSYTLDLDQRRHFCAWLAAVKFPDGFASNISKCVSVGDGKISGMKSHDCHVFMQRLLPVAIGGFLQPNIRLALTELSSFFKALCARTLTLEVLKQLQYDIAIILCKLEMIFPPGFFDIMVHLAIHLPREAFLAGPVQYRWMYPFERYLGKFKRYVRNKARPEGSIAEAYVHVECLTFCSLYIHDVETIYNREERNRDIDKDTEGGNDFSIFSQKIRPLGSPTSNRLDEALLAKARWYVLNNCAEISQYIDEHYTKIKDASLANVERRHQNEFSNWFRTRIQDLRSANRENVSDDIYALACGPDPWVASFSACIMNGTRFHTLRRGEYRRTQNSGVVVKGEHNSKPIDFYGVLNDILQLRYMGWRHVYLFRCEWFDVGDMRRGIVVGEHITSVNTSRKWYRDEPFALACQVCQVFYLKDNSKRGNWSVVQRVNNRNMYDVPTIPLENDDDENDDQNLDIAAFQENEPSYVEVEPEYDDNGMTAPLHRSDIQPVHVASDITLNDPLSLPDHEDFIDDGIERSDDDDTSSSEALESNFGTSSEDVFRLCKDDIYCADSFYSINRKCKRCYPSCGLSGKWYESIAETRFQQGQPQICSYIFSLLVVGFTVMTQWSDSSTSQDFELPYGS